MQTKELYLFDICGTLYRSNTTYDFLKFYFKRNNKGKYLRYRMCLSLPAKVLWKFLTFAGKRYKVRKFLIGFLKNEDVSLVTSEAHFFVKEYLNDRKINPIHQQLLEAKKNPKTEIWLISASISPVVEAIASSLGVSRFVATSLEHSNHNFTGEITEELEGKKQQILNDLGILKPSISAVVFTDSKEDKELVFMAQEAYIVGKNVPQEFWKNYVSEKTSLHFILY